ncbi:MAG: hypothetical protein QNK36_08190, partial [Colwellia sp.]|nr:hypothetical protein [Colwellia sp.]
LLIFCVSCNSTGGQEPIFKTEYLHSKPGKITIVKTDTQTIFKIQNEFGIGRGKVSLVEGSWPNKYILRLHLKGLEGISIMGSGQKFEKFNLVINKNSKSGENYFDVTLPKSLFSTGKEIHFS